MNRFSLSFVLAALVGCGTIPAADPGDGGTPPPPPPPIDAGIPDAPVPPDGPDVPDDGPRPVEGPPVAEAVEVVGGAGSTTGGPFSIDVMVGAGTPSVSSARSTRSR